MERPLILISNDDGYQAPGLKHLIDCVKDFGDIVAVAPAQHQSGMSSAITVSSPLRIFPVDDSPGARIFAVTGTPVDCVKLAMHTVCRSRRPAIMLSGVNHGSNAAVNAIYSGTMGAAFEACMCGIPAIAFSLLSHSMDADFSRTTPYIRHITAAVMQRGGLPDGVCLNVNFPAKSDIKGMKVLRAARGYWSDEYTEYTDPHGFPFYWLAGSFHNDEPDADDTDEYWLARGYASIVPERAEQTAFDCLDTLRDMLTEGAPSGDA